MAHNDGVLSREALEVQANELVPRWASLDTQRQRLFIDAVFKVFGKELYEKLLRRYQFKDSANEVFSRMQERLMRSIGQFRGESSLRTWLHRIAGNIANDYDREQQREPVQLRTEQEEQIVDTVWSQRSATKPWKKTTVKDLFNELRGQLSPDEQRLLELRFDKKLSWLDLAKAWDPEIASDEEQRKLAVMMKQRFSRLKVKLRKLFADAGFVSTGDRAS